MIVRKTYKFRLYPKRSQLTLLEKQLDLCTWLYNESLTYKKKKWEEEKVNISLYDLNNKLKEWKSQKPELKDIHSQVLQKIQERVDLAFKAFFQRIKKGENPGYPRFKNKDRLIESLKFPQTGYSIVSDNKVKISKIGLIKFVYHRKVIGNIKNCILKRERSGKWYILFVAEYEKGSDWNKTNKVVGGDLGCKTLITFSDGNKIDNPRFFKEEERGLAKVDRKISLTRELNEKELTIKYKKIQCKIHERIKNKRENYAFQTANGLVKQYDTLIFEKLDINNMNSFRGRNKSIRDAAWNELISKIVFKAENAGKQVIFVDPAYTSKTCSRCGKIHNDFDNSKDFMNCECGNHMQRDENASLNILRRGLASFSNSNKVRIEAPML